MSRFLIISNANISTAWEKLHRRDLEFVAAVFFKVFNDTDLKENILTKIASSGMLQDRPQ